MIIDLKHAVRPPQTCRPLITPGAGAGAMNTTLTKDIDLNDVLIIVKYRNFFVPSKDKFN